VVAVLAATRGAGDGDGTGAAAVVGGTTTPAMRSSSA